MSGSGACRDNLDSRLDNMEIDAPAPQEMPAQQEPRFDKSGLKEACERGLALGRTRQEFDLQLLLDILLEIERLEGRSPAFQKLVEALTNMCDKFYPHQCKFHGPAICDRCEALRQASEALRLACEGEE